MELNIRKQPIAASELMLAATAEHPIECDVLLPDYCPDVMRVLCCRVQGTVTDAVVRGNLLTVEGTATVTLCYLGEVGGVRSTEYRLPFSKSFELPAEPADPVWEVTVDQGYCNCRAASRRRVDIRGTLLISVKVFDTVERPVVNAAEGMGVQLKSLEFPAVKMGGQVLRHFSLSEELSTPAGNEPAAEIVRADCRPVIQESRVVAGRVVLKGELMVHLLYKSDLATGKLETADYSLPLSQMLEADGAVDGVNCEAEVNCVQVECNPDEDAEGTGHIRLEARFAAQLRFYMPVMAAGAADSYSTNYESEAATQKMRVLRELRPIGERAAIREESDLPEGALSVLDVWAVAGKGAVQKTDAGLSASGQVFFAVLLDAGEQGVDCVLHTGTVQADLSVAAGATAELTPRLVVLSASAAIAGGRLTITAQVLVAGAMMLFEQKSLLTDVKVDQNSPKKTDPAVGLMICFAQAGESVWDISKRYGSLPAQVMADNALTCEVLEQDAALIIPAV